MDWEKDLIQAVVNLEFVVQRCTDDNAKKKLWEAYKLLAHVSDSLGLRD